MTDQKHINVEWEKDLFMCCAHGAVNHPCCVCGELIPVADQIGIFKDEISGAVDNIRFIERSQKHRIRSRFVLGENGHMHWYTKDCDCSMCLHYRSKPERILLARPTGAL
jgi:hypothetical protein